MAITQSTYSEGMSTERSEPQSIWLVIDGVEGEDLNALHEELRKAVDGLKEEHHKVRSGVAPSGMLCESIAKDRSRRR